MAICSQLEYLNESGARGSHVSKLHRYLWVVVATNLKVIAIALLSILIVKVYFFGEIEKMTTSTLMKKLSMATVGAVVVALGAVDSAQAFGFTGAYAPSNWTLSNDNADGYVDTSNAPSSISIIGGDLGLFFGSGQTTYTTTALIGGLLSFNWSYQTFDIDGPGLDPFGFVLNGAFTQLTDNLGPYGQSGAFSTILTQGDIFGFGINTTDNRWGPGNATISDFAAPVPEPASTLGMLIGVGAMLKRKQQQKAKEKA
jgi:PEP-CTERM putative exosortase interaction domain